MKEQEMIDLALESGTDHQSRTVRTVDELTGHPVVGPLGRFGLGLVHGVVDVPHGLEDQRSGPAADPVSFTRKVRPRSRPGEGRI